LVVRVAVGIFLCGKSVSLVSAECGSSKKEEGEQNKKGEKGKVKKEKATQTNTQPQ